MSQSLAAAKKRRANFQEPVTTPSNNRSTANESSLTQPTGLTLPQVIQLVDRRLSKLESFMNDSINNPSPNRELSTISNSTNSNSEMPSNIDEIVEEFDKRYNMLAEEIINIKNIVLSLQSYTMEVNKTLLDERVRIFSDLEEQQQQHAEA
jgi:hypothetical protein